MSRAALLRETEAILEELRPYLQDAADFSGQGPNDAMFLLAKLQRAVSVVRYLLQQETQH